MKRIYLFPNRLKIPALVIFVISLILIILHYSDITTEINATVFVFVSDTFTSTANKTCFAFDNQNIYNEILDCTFFISGIILAFSKEKVEDEMITFIRLKSLVYTTYFIFVLLILSEIFIYGIPFLNVIMGFLYSFVILTNIFYYTKLFIYKKQFSYENED